MKKLLLLYAFLGLGHGFSATASDKQTSFFAAVKDGDFDLVKELSEQGAPLYAKDENGSTALMWAACGERAIVDQALNINIQRDYLAIMQFLIARGADVNEKNKWNKTALFYAVISENLDHLRCLIEAKAGLDIKDDQGNTVLHKSIYRNNLAFVNELIAAGAYVDSIDGEGETPLAVAAWYGYEDCARAFIKTKADLNKFVGDGKTPLVHAVASGHLPLVKLLVEAGAEINWRDTEEQSLPLIMAVSAGQPEVVEYLISAGANVQLQDKSGSTALIAAAYAGDFRSFKALLKAGAKRDAQNSFKNSALLFLTEFASQQDARVAIKLLLEMPVNKTLLLQKRKVRGNGDSKVRKIFSDVDRLINMKNQNGFTALMAAADKGRLDVVRTLLEYPMIDRNLRSDRGNTALDIAKLLRDIYMRQVQDETVIDSLAFTDCLEIIDLLEKPRHVCKRS